MQNFKNITVDTKVKDSLVAIIANDTTALSNSAGSAFPTASLFVGMQCWRTDENQMYTLTAVDPATWVSTADLMKKGQPFGLAELDGSGSLAQRMKISYNQPGAIIRDFSGDEKGKSSVMVAGAMYDNAGPLQLRTGIWSSEQAYTIRLTGMVDSPTMHGAIDITIWKEITTAGIAIDYINNGGANLRIDYGVFDDGYHGFNLYTKSDGGLGRCQLMVAEVSLMGEDLDDEQFTGWSFSDVLESLPGAFSLGRNVTVEAGAIISSATQIALDKKANIASPEFTGTVKGITAAMVGLPDVNNTADSVKPVSTLQQAALNLKFNAAGGNITGPVSAFGSFEIDGQLYLPNNGLRLSGNGWNSYIRQAADTIGFINNANNAYNMQISDAGIVYMPRARPTWAGLSPWDNGNLNPANYETVASANALENYLQTQINARPGRDYITTCGWASGNPSAPYFADGGGSYSWLITQNGAGGLHGFNRANGYIEIGTDIGQVGCNYFVSDIRKKEKIESSTIDATSALRKFNLISYNYKKDSGQDTEIRQQVGFSAQEAVEIDPAFASALSDGTLMPNALPFISYLMKAFKEMDERIVFLESQNGR